jgi:hypothetical protein
MSQDNQRKDGEDFTNGLAGIGPESIRQILGALEFLKAFRQPRAPRIVPEGIYSLSDLVENLEMSENTIRTWYSRKEKAKRLKVLQPATRRMFFKGADVLAYMEANPEG